MTAIRYLVFDVESSINFYTKILGFELVEQYGPAMAIIKKDELSLWLAGPQSSAAQTLPDGQKPQPGGWNRLVLQVDDLPSIIERLETQNVVFKSKSIKGPAGSQILCEDPSGNVVELFEPN